MNRPPRKHPLDSYKAKPVVARFRADDRELIEGVWSRVGAEQPITDPLHRHVADCIAHAVKGFHERLARSFPLGLPVVDREQMLTLCKPPTFFDEYVIALVVQDICDITGMGVAVSHLEPPVGRVDPKWGRCPDVIFQPL